MSSFVLYENVIAPNEHISTDALISLSEAGRGEDSQRYADMLEGMIENLKKPSAKIMKQPDFKWMGCKSSCFRFELQRALFDMFKHHMECAMDNEKSSCEHFDLAVLSAKRATNNLIQWTAISPELVRYPPFHLNYVLAMACDAQCRRHSFKFNALTKDIDQWKCGVVTQAMKESLEEIESACRWCALANILWARPDGKGGVTSTPDEFEVLLVKQFHRVSSYASPTFQQRLDHAAMCCNHFEDMQEIMNLNSKLYYLTPTFVEPPAPASLEALCAK